MERETTEGEGKRSSHLLVDELEPLVNVGFRFFLILLDESWTDELVDCVVGLEKGKFLWEKEEKRGGRRVGELELELKGLGLGDAGSSVEPLD